MSKLLNFTRFFQRNFSRTVRTSRKQLFSLKSLKHTKSKQFLKYSSILMSGAVFGTYYKSNHNIIAASIEKEECDKCGREHILSRISEMTTVDAKFLLERLLDKLNCLENNGQILDFKFVFNLFNEAGIKDEEVAKSIFDVMDWNNSGKLEPENIAGIFSIVHEGDDMGKFEFLFHCLDLDGNGKIDKHELRRVLLSLYEVGYRISGLKDDLYGDHAFVDMDQSDYHTFAKFKSNMLVNDIFQYADLNRDGVLDHTEFMRWASRHGRDSKILANLLRNSLGEEEERDRLLGKIEYRM